MKIIDIPPYQRAGVNYDPAEGHFMMRDLVASMRARGQLDGVEIDIDEGEPTEHGAETRDDEVVAQHRGRRRQARQGRLRDGQVRRDRHAGGNRARLSRRDDGLHAAHRLPRALGPALRLAPRRKMLRPDDDGRAGA